MKIMFRTMALLAVVTLAGCATPAPKVETTTTDAAAEGGGAMQDGAMEDGMGAEAEGLEAGAEIVTAAECPPECAFQRDAIDDPNGLLAERTIYFAFDSSVVKQKYMDIIKRHAAYLARYPEVEVRVEGHTDERGSREYNIGLGARRAESVSRLLQAYGASAQQITTISYGEEVPAVEGHNPYAWSQNRRVELVYPSSELNN